MNEEVEEIKRMMRVLHNDIANVRREQEIGERRIFELTYMIAEYFHIPGEDVEKVINLDPQHYEGLDDLYSPIDEVDKNLWEEHLRKEREEKEMGTFNENIALKEKLKKLRANR